MSLPQKPPGSFVATSEYNAIIDTINTILTSIDASGHVLSTPGNLVATGPLTTLTDNVAIVSSGGAVDGTLPDAATSFGHTFRVKWFSGPHTARILAGGSDRIYVDDDIGVTSFTFDVIGQSNDFFSNGFGWLVQ